MTDYKPDDRTEIALLRVVQDRGGSLELGPRDHTTKDVARRLLSAGRLSGTSKRFRITALGIKALADGGSTEQFFEKGNANGS